MFNRIMVLIQSRFRILTSSLKGRKIPVRPLIWFILIVLGVMGLPVAISKIGATLAQISAASPTKKPTSQETKVAPIIPTVRSAILPAPTEPTARPAALSVPTATARPRKPGEVFRDETLNLVWYLSSPIGVTNPWAVPGYSHQEANAMLWEGLAYYAIYADQEIPWLAESMTYTTPDFTQLLIKLRQEAMWSDGVPLTAQDVVFTLQGQLTNSKLTYHEIFTQYVQSVDRIDDLTVLVTFKLPAPRFKFDVLTLKFDSGIPIVPEHILSKQSDVNTFPGGLDMPHSGPYTITAWDASKKVLDLREDWWAVKAGIAQVPEVKRIVMTNNSLSMELLVQGVVANEFDTTPGMTGAQIDNILKSNPKVTTHTGNKPPYGSIDPWPNALWVNTQLTPYSDADIRRAMSLSIDRDKIDERLYDGARVATIYPFPLYPNLEKFTGLPEVKALEEKYQPRKYDLAESARLMQAAGFTRNASGLWSKGGQTVNATINGFESIHADIASLLVEMLRQGGFDAKVNFDSDAFSNMTGGKPGLYLFGHSANLIDPYATFELFHSRYSAGIGTATGYPYFSRYKNTAYDAILDQMAPLGSDDPKFTELAVKALEIYWREVIDIPLIQWVSRVPYNQTYWSNWPTEANPGLGVNGQFWNHTGMLLVANLKAVQP